MKFWDYHIHSRLCRHADGEIEEYILSAINKGIEEIGISEHIPWEYVPDTPNIPRKEYGMPESELNGYFSTLVDLKSKYKGEINIKFGMEIDFISWKMDEIKEFIKQHSSKLDYIIGSIHYVNSPNIGSWPIDDHRHDFFKEVGIDNVYNQYLDTTLELVGSGLYDILAHCDLPKKNGYRPSNKEEFLDKYNPIFDKVKETGMCVELNTAGLRKPIKEIYPEVDILKMIIERDIPMVLSSDSHNPNDIGKSFTESLSLLKKLGLKNMCKFTRHKMEIIEI